MDPAGLRRRQVPGVRVSQSSAQSHHVRNSTNIQQEVRQLHRPGPGQAARFGPREWLCQWSLHHQSSPQPNYQGLSKVRAIFSP